MTSTLQGVSLDTLKNSVLRSWLKYYGPDSPQVRDLTRRIKSLEPLSVRCIKRNDQVLYSSARILGHSIFYFPGYWLAFYGEPSGDAWSLARQLGKRLGVKVVVRQ